MMKSEDAPIQNENMQHGYGDISESNESKARYTEIRPCRADLVAQRKVASFKRTAPSKSRISVRNSNVEPESNSHLNPIPHPLPIPIKDDSKII